MVMTLRKRSSARVQPLESETEIDSESEMEMEMEMEKKSKTKTKRAKREEDWSSDSDSDSENEVAIEYENLREQRIQENKERMLKLGMFSLSSQFFNNNNNNNNKKKKKAPPPPKKKKYPPLYPTTHTRPRRSSTDTPRMIKLGNGEYLESEGLLKDMGISVPEAWKAEVYTAEDEKLLGDCETNWTLKVDGFSEDGDRLYDPHGTPCHQCRQKVLGKLTYCGNCRASHGHFCGDCLYTRYGENVLEAVKNLSWSCPVCRGICNCSRCRRTKGWEPINIQHSKLVESGFKSVAHYLILTRRADTPPINLNDGVVETVDLTAAAAPAPAPQQDEGSDYSAESSEFESESDDDTEAKKEQTVEIQADEVAAAAAVAVADDKDQPL